MNCQRFIAYRYFKTILPFWLIYVLVALTSQIINSLPYRTYFDGQNIITGTINMLIDFSGLQSLFGTPSLDSSWWYMGAAITFILTVPFFTVLIKKLGWFPLVLSVIIIPRILGLGFLGGTAPLSFVFSALLGVIFEHYNLFNLFNKIHIRFFDIKAVEQIITFLLFLGTVFIGFFVYTNLNISIFWELSYGIVPLTFIVFANRYITRIPYLCKFLGFFGKHSANIFFIHTVLRSYLTDFIYAQPNFIISILIFTVLSLLGSILIELFKKVIRFNRITEAIINTVSGKNAEHNKTEAHI